MRSVTYSMGVSHLTATSPGRTDARRLGSWQGLTGPAAN